MVEKINSPNCSAPQNFSSESHSASVLKILNFVPKRGQLLLVFMLFKFFLLTYGSALFFNWLFFKESESVMVLGLRFIQWRNDVHRSQHIRWTSHLTCTSFHWQDLTEVRKWTNGFRKWFSSIRSAITCGPSNAMLASATTLVRMLRQIFCSYVVIQAETN